MSPHSLFVNTPYFISLMSHCMNGECVSGNARAKSSGLRMKRVTQLHCQQQQRLANMRQWTIFSVFLEFHLKELKLTRSYKYSCMFMLQLVYSTHILYTVHIHREDLVQHFPVLQLGQSNTLFIYFVSLCTVLPATRPLMFAWPCCKLISLVCYVHTIHTSFEMCVNS